MMLLHRRTQKPHKECGQLGCCACAYVMYKDDSTGFRRRPANTTVATTKPLQFPNLGRNLSSRLYRIRSEPIVAFLKLAAFARPGASTRLQSTTRMGGIVEGTWYARNTWLCIYIYVYVCVCMSVCMYVCNSVCMCMYVYVCVCVCVYVCMCMCMCMQLYVYIHIHAIWGPNRL